MVHFEIRERRLQPSLEPSQHIVRHPPVLHPSSIFALPDIAGVHDEQCLDLCQGPSTTLKFQKALSFCEETFLDVEALQ